jgi:hypothetical protein
MGKLEKEEGSGSCSGRKSNQVIACALLRAAPCWTGLDWLTGLLLPRAHSWSHHQPLPNGETCGRRECPELHLLRESLSTNSTIPRFLVSLPAQPPFVSSASPQVQSVLVLVHLHRSIDDLCVLSVTPPQSSARASSPCRAILFSSVRHVANPALKAFWTDDCRTPQ